MRHQRVRWLQSSSAYPVVLWSEVDDDGWEVRKVEEFADGRLALAGAESEAGGAFLGLDRVPPLASINTDPQFEGEEVSRAEFDAAWERAVHEHPAAHPRLYGGATASRDDGDDASERQGSAP